MQTGDLFSETKRPEGEANHSPYLVSRLRMKGAIFPLPHTLSWRAQNLKFLYLPIFIDFSSRDLPYFCTIHEKPDIIDIRAEQTAIVWPRQKDGRRENIKINYGLDTTGEKEKRTSKKNVDGRSTSSHDNKKFRTRSMEEQRGMAFGFRKTATAVKKPER